MQIEEMFWEVFQMQFIRRKVQTLALHLLPIVVPIVTIQSIRIMTCWYKLVFCWSTNENQMLVCGSLLSPVMSISFKSGILHMLAAVEMQKSSKNLQDLLINRISGGLPCPSNKLWTRANTNFVISGNVYFRQRSLPSQHTTWSHFISMKHETTCLWPSSHFNFH